MRDIGSLPRLATKALAKEIGDVGLVVDDEDAETHAALSAPAIGVRRDRRIVNSANSPTSLSTVIVPPCYWVTMS